MCLALSPLAGFAISAATAAGSAVLNYAQQSSQASATEKYQRQAHALNTEIAEANALQQYAAFNRRRIQEREAAGQEIAQMGSEARRAQSFTTVAAAAGGISGGSVAALYDDFERQELDYQESVLRSEEFAELQLRDDQRAVQSNTRSRIAQTMPRPVPRPSLVNLGLSIAGSTLGSFNRYSTPNPDTGYRELRS